MVSGEIDFSVPDDVSRQILGSIDNEDAGLILDLTKLSYTDSARINLVFDLASRLSEHRQTFRDRAPRRLTAVANLLDRLRRDGDRCLRDC